MTFLNFSADLETVAEKLAECDGQAIAEFFNHLSSHADYNDVAISEIVDLDILDGEAKIMIINLSNAIVKSEAAKS